MCIDNVRTYRAAACLAKANFDAASLLLALVTVELSSVFCIVVFVGNTGASPLALIDFLLLNNE
jgi:hypothetical protein